MMPGGEQSENKSKHVDMFAVDPRETLPVPKSARLPGRPRQAGNELMNHHRRTLRLEITSSHETKAYKKLKRDENELMNLMTRGGPKP